MALSAEEALALQQRYIDAKEAADRTKEILDTIKAQIIEAAGNEPFRGRLLSLRKTRRKGNIDYSSLFRFHDISTREQDAYRRPDTESFAVYVNPPEQEE